jgi:fluoride exporter
MSESENELGLAGAAESAPAAKAREAWLAPSVGRAFVAWREKWTERMLTYLAIAVGGTLGCWGRYAMTNLVQGIFGRDFPYATLSINLLGSFLMGFLFVATLERLIVSPILRTGILTGGLGGFTTFSTFAMESRLLLVQGETGKAMLYMGLSLGLGVLLAFAGAWLAIEL